MIVTGGIVDGGIVKGGIVLGGIDRRSASSASVPSQSISLASASSQWLTMSDANFGAYDRAKWAYSGWVTRASISTQQTIYAQYDSAGNRAFQIYFDPDNTLRILCSEDGTYGAGNLATTATYTTTGTYMHILFWYDSANGTSGDRMRLWVNGAEITAFGVDTAPTGAVFNSTGVVTVGAQTSGGASPYNGLIYQASFFSGTLPAIGTVYNAGAAVSLTGATGLWSTLDVAGGDVTSDEVLAAAWTNNNAAIASSTIPA
jgi:hypothetical protein